MTTPAAATTQPRPTRRRALTIAVAVLAAFLAAGLTPTGLADAQPTPAPAPSSSTAPCTGQGCIPPPSTAAPAPAAPTPAPAAPPSTDSGGSGSWIGNLLNGWMHSFFATLVGSALNPLLDLFSQYILVTPPLDQLPVMGQLWGNSQQIMIAVYVFAILAAGVILIAYHTLQAQHSIREILPRLVVGFLAANLSLFFGGKAIEFANALSQAVLGPRVNPDVAAESLRTTLLSQIDPNQGPIFIFLIGAALAVMLIAVLLTFIIRVALTVILLAGAPLFLMCHALPQTEGIAFWWWKAFAGVLAIQVAQSLTLTTAIELFFLPGGIALFN